MAKGKLQPLQREGQAPCAAAGGSAGLGAPRCHGDGLRCVTPSLFPWLGIRRSFPSATPMWGRGRLAGRPPRQAREQRSESRLTPGAAALCLYGATLPTGAAGPWRGCASRHVSLPEERRQRRLGLTLRGTFRSSAGPGHRLAGGRDARDHPGNRRAGQGSVRRAGSWLPCDDLDDLLPAAPRAAPPSNASNAHGCRIATGAVRPNDATPSIKCIPLLFRSAGGGPAASRRHGLLCPTRDCSGQPGAAGTRPQNLIKHQPFALTNLDGFLSIASPGVPAASSPVLPRRASPSLAQALDRPQLGTDSALELHGARGGARRLGAPLPARKIPAASPRAPRRTDRRRTSRARHTDRHTERQTRALSPHAAAILRRTNYVLPHRGVLRREEHLLRGGGSRANSKQVNLPLGSRSASEARVS